MSFKKKDAMVKNFKGIKRELRIKKIKYIK